MPKIIKEKTYKVFVSILFGIIGFFANFNTIIFPFGDYTVAILFGLLFPLLISLSWGWKYGVLSAIAGGTQSMWWLWGPSNGYAIFLVVPPFTFWIAWHGYLARRRTQEDHKWWFNIYIWEIPFRLLSTLNILTIVRWAVKQNPPDWEWAGNAPNTISFGFSLFVAIKQAVIGYILLLTADVLLNLPIIRQFFRLKPISNQKYTGPIISAALLIGFFYWFLDSILCAYLAKDGLSFIDYLARDIPSTNFSTRIVFIICSLTAGLITSKLIQRQKNDEIALQKIQKEAINREVFLSSLINAMPDLVWLKDKDGVYLACNSRFEAFFGAKERDILGKTDYDFLEKHLADFFRNHDRNAMTKCSALTNEEEIIFAKDGHRELLETTKTPMYDNNGELIGILGIGRDITERKLLQEQLAQSRKLESVGRLAGGVAHDFNNMLSIIVGNSELLQDELPEGSLFDEHLQQILYAAKRSAGLTRQLLAFARQETISPKILDLNDNLESILNMLRRLIGENIELIWKPGKNIWAVHMDAGQIDQIMTNLCVNARDSIHNVGRITIETQNISVDEAYCLEHSDARVQDYVMLTISDTGAGMSKEVQEHIFEPFYTTKISGKGIGLGLATVYGIMKQNQGIINVYSEPERGSTFKLFFPRCSTREEAKTLTEEHRDLPSGNEIILLVEDEPAILEITKTKLEQLGYTVHAYADPTQAVVRSENIENADLLITDVIMPKMSGLDLSREITSMYPKIKSLFMSGYTADVISHHGILHKGLNFINKPFTIKDLSMNIRNILDS